MNIEEKINEIEKDPKYRAQFIRHPIKRKSDSWKETANQWLVHFPNGQTQNYFTGYARREFKPGGPYNPKSEYEAMRNKNLTDYGFENLMKSSKPTKPKLKDVLYSLTMDAHAANVNFQDWCADFGYDDDSMKAMEIYKSCIESAGSLRGLGFDIEELQEFFQDY